MKNIIVFSCFITLFFVFACKPSDSITIVLTDSKCNTPGRFVPEGEIPKPSEPSDLALDAYCADRLIKTKAPNGVITIFGSARAKEGMKSYDITRKFAYLWTKEMGKKYPILTGGGPGIMEAGNRGAMEAKGQSLSFGTYFGGGMEKPNKYTTGGYMFASFSQREAEMVDRGAAIVIAPGGFGTEWEIFETLSKIQTRKKKHVPVVLLGDKKTWNSLLQRIRHLGSIKTISPEDINILQIAETAEKAVKIIKDYLTKQESAKK
jgi:uncharacterized protein (TIGR00730 family)